MKNRGNIFLASLFCLLFSSLFLLKGEVSFADDPKDYFTELNKEGDVVQGTIFKPDKPVFRPEYKGEDLLRDVVKSNGVTPFFYDFSTAIPYNSDDIMYYNNVGVYNNKPVSLKMTHLVGPKVSTERMDYKTILGRSGSTNQHVRRMNRASGEGSISYQLVYTDTKKVVSGIYLEMPVLILNPSYSAKYPDIGFDGFEMNNLKKVYYHRLEEQLTITYYDIVAKDSKKLLRLNYSKKTNYEKEARQYVTVVDNDYPTVIGSYSLYDGFSIHNFVGEVNTPGMPNYSQPNIEGNKTETFTAEYQVEQTLIPAYEKNYPDNVTIILEDKEKLFTTLDSATVQLVDSGGNDITSNVTVKPIGTTKLSVTLSKSTLQELGRNRIDMKVAIDKIDVTKANKLYNASTGTIKLPLTTYNIRQDETEEIISDSSTASAEVMPQLSAEYVTPTVPVGSSTKDLDLKKLLKNVSSNIPGDEIIYSVLQDKEFNTVKVDSLVVKIQSELMPNVIKTVMVPINVTDELISTDFFENQAWIIDNINEQLKPKKIGSNVYLSDLMTITKIDTEKTRPFKGQHIPKNIKALKNLELLYLRNTKMSGSLPQELGSLTNMTDLRIFDNTLTGGIPKELGNLKNLEYLYLDMNDLTGTIPKEIALLPKLHSVYLDRNKFVGLLPDFKDGLKILHVGSNQLTYNSDQVPSFITSAVNKGMNESFLSTLSLKGNGVLTVNDGEIIRPFDPAAARTFDLHAFSTTNGKQALYDEHIYTIKNQDGTVLYEGSAEKNVSISHKRGTKYTVILDKADKNPNNVFKVTVKEEDVITAAFFENQAWIIDNINDQLSPKKIDVDVFQSDLDTIKKVITDNKRPFKGQHIPKNIKALTNLESLHLRNTKMSGSLPEELGNLTKMKDLRIFDNTLTGEIPKSLTNLKDIEYLYLDQNGLTGTIPTGLKDLPKLHSLYLDKNKLVGLLPDFKDGLEILHVGNNQLTYNSDQVPSFITSAVNKGIDESFLSTLSLKGNGVWNIREGQIIRPFDPAAANYFDLHAFSTTKGKQALYGEHIYTIKNQDGTVLYEGSPVKNASIFHEKGTTYTVILDKADQNPNNVFKVTVKEEDVITSDFFENQAWIIDNINDQLSPKKIDVDVFQSDLDTIKKVITDNKRPFKGQHIPKNIKALTNLESLHLRNTKMSGSLPEELGNLTKMKDLRIFDNTLTGEIPKSLTNLKDIEYLYLDQNGLTGTIPTGLKDLPKLHSLYLDKNKLVGLLPDFKDGLEILHVGNNQLTYNSDQVPSFITSAVNKGIDESFLSTLSLKGNGVLNIKEGQIIRPFDPAAANYFDLHAFSTTKGKQALYGEHIYTIKNQDGTVLYEGSPVKNASIFHEKGTTYTVILDKADQNPNNVFTVQSKIPELKLNSIPSKLSFSITAKSNQKKPVKPIDGHASVFDNRGKGNWQLSILPSELISGNKRLIGEYQYLNTNGTANTIIMGQKVSIEKGSSDEENEIIPVSEKWTDKQGLHFNVNQSNYLGDYKGSITWILEDVPR